jgi:hypothetical protein
MMGRLGWIPALVALALAVSPCLGKAKTLTLEDVMIDVDGAATDCTVLDRARPVSAQAATHYDMDSPDEFAGTARQAKTYQSLECGDERGTIYYYQYKKKSHAKQALNFAETHIWGDGGRSEERPEMIFAIENVIVVISSKDAESFEERIRAGLEPVDE